MGGYFYVIHRNIKSRAALHPIYARLIPTALVLLFCATTAPYLPEKLPLKSILHIVLAFLSATLVLLYLFWIIRTRYQTGPGAYRSFLYGWETIMGVSVILLAVAGIISSVLEIYVTLTSITMAQHLTYRVTVQEKIPGSGRDTSEKASRRGSLGKRHSHLLA